MRIAEKSSYSTWHLHGEMTILLQWRFISCKYVTSDNCDNQLCAKSLDEALLERNCIKISKTKNQGEHFTKI
jgi:hypothetical protein